MPNGVAIDQEGNVVVVNVGNNSPACCAYAAAARVAKELGHTNIKHLSAGISGWKDAGAPIEK